MGRIYQEHEPEALPELNLDHENGGTEWKEVIDWLESDDEPFRQNSSGQYWGLSIDVPVSHPFLLIIFLQLLHWKLWK